MQVAESNNVKIYNLSSGRSLPEWLSARKRRALLKKDVDIQKRIELIQGFDMPDLSTTVKITDDGQSIIATGTYKPRVKCFDVNNLSQKFDRGFDSEAVTFEILSDDYSKLAFLQCDRYLEFHVAHGRHERFRIPRYGRDMKMYWPTAEMFIVGVSSDIYRFNLELGKFMTSLTSEASVINRCAINDYVLLCGTKEGTVECWDPRCRNMVAKFDCAFNCINECKRLEKFPSITAINFADNLNIGVGTANGLVMLYDIRSNKPYLIKDHMEELPIKDIEFNKKQNIVFSMNKSILKMWDKDTGKPYASIEAAADFNNLCVVKDTGLLFIANEREKILTFYVPSIGPAPKWASFLDSLTEELEESNVENIYDDYKFITKSEIAALGLELDHLISNNLVRAYMHGYFMDARLYKKAKMMSQAFSFEEFQKNKVQETLKRKRKNVIKLSLPPVNRELYQTAHEKGSYLLKDERFSKMFSNPDYEIDKDSEEYRLTHHQAVRKKIKLSVEEKKEEVEEQELEGTDSSDDSDGSF